MKRTETELEIIQSYKDGLSMAKVGKLYNVTAATVLRILKENNIETRTKGGIYKIPEQELSKLYQSGKSCKEIADIYGVTWSAIAQMLKKCGIDRDNRYYNLTLDTKYFDVIDRYDKAYFLGFLITDGNVGKTSNAIALCLKSTDEDILNTFSAKTFNTNKLYKAKNRNEITFVVKCEEWKKDLEKYGVVPQKTYKTYLPEVAEDMMPHLMRGIIDGDGWISYKSHSIGLCGNKDLVEQVKEYLVNKLNVYNVKVLQTQPHLWQINWASKKDVNKICEYIYKDKQDCYLQRKYNNYLSLYGNTEVS